MAFPTVVINNSTGSNTAASGAGPAIAVTGTAAACAGGTSQRVAFNETTDLSTVATDGSAVIWIDSGSITFMQITAVKDTQQTFTGDVNSTDGVVINVSSTAGLSIGDYINRSGSGANNLYIVSIDSATQITLNATPGVNQAGDTLIDRRQVTVDRQPGAFSAQTWAIGGKRKDFETNNERTKLLFTSAKAGWTIDLQETGTNYTLTSTINIGAAGDTTNGRITFYSSSSTRPTITSSTNSIPLFTCTGNGGWEFKHLKLTHTAATRGRAFVEGASLGFSFMRIFDCIVDGCLNFMGAGSRGHSLINIHGCYVTNCTSTGLVLQSVSSIDIFGCIFSNNAGGVWSSAGLNSNFIAINTVFYNNSGNALEDNAAGSVRTDDMVVVNCLFHSNDASGIEQENLSTSTLTTMVINCIFWNNGGWGQKYLEGLGAMDYYRRNHSNNAYGQNTSGSIDGIAVGINDIVLTADPCVDAANGNFALNNTIGGGASCRAAGFPGIFAGNLTTGYIDIGAAQHEDAGTGETIIKFFGVRT
jgi:hypothetical protein